MGKIFSRFNVISSVSILIALVILRSCLLGYSDLVDPTESRYASVAQQMVLDSDWITPKLPQPEGIVPYLGKPPLHFWLTALSYKVLGFTNFASRLPSLLATIAILIVTLLFGRRFFDRETADTAALISISCGLFYFLAGSSVVDVTLSACVCASVVSFAFYYEKPSRKQAMILGTSLALGFLTKGPVAPALFFFAVVPFLISQHKIKDLLTYHWGTLLSAFFIVATPWFIISEIDNPGFSKYFFWNENLARYLIKDYGDRYGGGHVYPRGSAWVMLLLAFMPWSIPFVCGLILKNTRQGLWQNIKNDKWLIYCLCWGLSPAVFFTLGRQLHVSYLLPGIPGLALLFSQWIKTNWNNNQKDILLKTLSILSAILCSALMLGAAIKGVSLILILAVFIPFLLIFGHYLFSTEKTALRTLPHTILQICLVFLCAILVTTPIIDCRKSTRSILEKILANSSDSQLRIGVVSDNDYSPYWLSKKWASEGNSRIKIEFVSNSPEQQDPPANLILKKGSEVNLAPEVFAQYELKETISKWRWFQKKS